MFVDRLEELAFLNRLLTDHRSAHLVLVYGRRRVGKSRLLRHWVAQTDINTTYWTATKEVSALQRRKFVAQFEQRPLHQTPLFDSWEEVWQLVAERIGSQQHILVLDELPYAAETDSAFLSSIQHAWDQHFETSNIIIVLCGSQLRVMEALQYHQSPLFGRFSAKWYLQPLPFYSLKTFFPDYSSEELVALYSIVGGIPAYLLWLDPNQKLVENIRDVILGKGSLFSAEPAFLLYDEVREPHAYLAILKAIGRGYHTLSEISNSALISKTHLSSYLVRLQELKLIERRIPATTPPAKRRKSRQGRYHFSDAYFQFYFRFISPYFDLLPDDPEPILQKVRNELRAFIGQTGFEELSRVWVRTQRQQGRLPFKPFVIGSHWSRSEQIDVVGVNWDTKEILLGECKWGVDTIGRSLLRELIEQKTPKLRKKLPNEGIDWKIHYAFFARKGFTKSAQEYANKHAILLVDLPLLIQGLEFNSDP